MSRQQRIERTLDIVRQLMEEHEDVEVEMSCGYDETVSDDMTQVIAEANDTYTVTVRVNGGTTINPY